MLSDTTLAYAEEVTRALLGVDAVYRAEAGDDAGLVVLDMATGHQAMAFRDYDEARAQIAELQLRAASLPEPDRRVYYDQLCGSTLALIQWRTGGLPFAEQVGRFLHVPADPPSEADLDALRAAMRTLLIGMGFAGDLAAQCAAWEARNRVPPDAAQETLTGLLDQAWDRTAARMPLPAPKSDGMRVRAVSEVPFNARCDYLSRMIELNIDPVLTYPALKHLAVHEGYPGHYVQFKLRETWYRDGYAAADGLLSLVNSASSCTFEGIADNGLRVIDWIETDDDRLSTVMTRYRSAIGTGAAWRLHALGWSMGRVAEWLREAALIGGEGWVANRMRFIAAPQRGALIWSYLRGESSVAPVWERTPVERRPQFVRYLYGRMHSPRSVAMFA